MAAMSNVGTTKAVLARGRGRASLDKDHFDKHKVLAAFEAQYARDHGVVNR